MAKGRTGITKGGKGKGGGKRVKEVKGTEEEGRQREREEGKWSR